MSDGASPGNEPASQPLPVLPEALAAQLPEPLRQKLHQLLLASGGQLESAYRARVQWPNARLTDLLPHTACAHVGALSNRMTVVYAVLNGQMPSGPSMGRSTAASVRSLLGLTRESDVRAHLTEVLGRLEESVEDAAASRAEDAKLEEKSAELEAAASSELRNASGVYVYTYPHYWKYPFVPGTTRRLLKIGKTDQGAFHRVRAQARQTGAPEDPLLLRVYVSPDPAESERTFHRLLDAAEHSRSEGWGAGREWFATTLEFCDEVARALRLQVLAAEVAV